jgi:hypothetical protein
MVKEKPIQNHQHFTFTFGKYSGQALENIEDLAYLKWAIDNINFDTDCADTNEFIKNIEARINELE